MLHLIETFNNLPSNIKVNSDTLFQPGHVVALKMKKGEAVIDICDGLHPFGIVDDIKCSHARCPSWEEHVIDLKTLNIKDINYENKTVVLKQEEKIKLNHENIIQNSFISNISCQLSPKIGEFKLFKDTGYKFSEIFCDKFDETKLSIIFSCKYAYNIPLLDDSTLSSGRATVWTKNMIAETDIYDITVEYHNYGILYSSQGLLTSKRADCQCKPIGVILRAPKVDNPMLKFLLDLEGKIDIGQYER